MIEEPGACLVCKPPEIESTSPLGLRDYTVNRYLMSLTDRLASSVVSVFESEMGSVRQCPQMFVRGGWEALRKELENLDRRINDGETAEPDDKDVERDRLIGT